MVKIWDWKIVKDQSKIMLFKTRESWLRSWVETECSKVCTHDQGQDSTTQTDYAQLIRIMLTLFRRFIKICSRRASGLSTPGGIWVDMLLTSTVGKTRVENRRANTCSQRINLPCALPLMNALFGIWSNKKNFNFFVTGSHKLTFCLQVAMRWI